MMIAVQSSFLGGGSRNPTSSLSTRPALSLTQSCLRAPLDTLTSCIAGATLMWLFAMEKSTVGVAISSQGWGNLFPHPNFQKPGFLV